MAINKHNPKLDVLTVNGYVIPITDLADEEIEFKRSEEGRYEIKVGVGGGSQSMRKANDNGMLTFSVFQGSAAHKFLLSIYEIGEDIEICSYKKGGVDMPPIIGTNGVLKALTPSSGADAKVSVEIEAVTVVGV